MNSNRIIELRERLSLSSLQREILIGTLLGDAHLEVTGFNACLRVKQGVKQRDYVFWKYDHFREWVLSSPRQILINRAWYFRTISHPELYENFLTFYAKGKKRVPDEISSLLNSYLSLAVWIMDDGARDENALRINTQSFSYEENELLRECLQANFGIASRINRDKSMFRLYIPATDARRLCVQIEPYMIPTLRYKLILPP